MSASSVPFGRRCAAVLLAAAAAVLVVAAPAQAKIPSGEGWSARWHYYATDSIEISATLPGARALAYVSDVGGTRRITGTLTDDASDGRCARVVATVPGVGTIDDKKLSAPTGTAAPT